MLTPITGRYTLNAPLGAPLLQEIMSKSSEALDGTNVTLDSLIVPLLNSSSIADVKAVIQQLVEMIGADYFAFVSLTQFPISAPTVRAITNYPEEWSEWYQAQNYVAVDPVIRHCQHSMTPIYWDDLGDIDSAAQSMMADAVNHGLASGVTIPVSSTSGVSGWSCFVTRKPNDHPFYERLKRHHAILYLFSVYVQEVATKLWDSTDKPSNVSLTHREKECLLWAAEGKTASEIALILGIQERTAIFHLNNATKKLNATNRQQAVARAIASGIIHANQCQKYHLVNI